MTAARRGVGRWGNHGLRTMGGGPWRVLADCPATSHNSLAAARGRESDTSVPAGATSGHPKCVCPHATQLLADYNRRCRELAVAKASGRPLSLERAESEHLAIARRVAGALIEAAPDLTGAGCASTLGRATFDRVLGIIDQEDRKARSVIAYARRVCEACPVREKCAAWVLSPKAGERHAGEWGGMFGGMTAGERAAVRREMQGAGGARR